MEEKVSIKGRTARRMVQVANHLPYLGNKAQNGELRRHLTEREKEWECPPHLERIFIERQNFDMELLHSKEEEDIGLILQLHGGGYYGKMHNTYRDMAAMYHEVSGGYSVLSIDYRVAPEYPFPAALEDALDAYRWICEQGYPPEELFVVGDSAGGGLALALVLYLRDHKMTLPKGIITMSAWTDLTKSGESYTENFKKDPMFGRSMDTLIYKEGYFGKEDPANPYISPVNGKYEGFPPMLMQVGEYEMLLSDTLSVAKKAKEAGVLVKEHTYTGMFHVFQMGKLLYPEAKEAWVEVGRFIRALTAENVREKAESGETRSERSGQEQRAEEDFPVIFVEDLENPELLIYKERTESGLLHFFEPKPGLFIAETGLVLERALNAGYEPVSVLVEKTKAEKIRQMLLERKTLSVPIFAGDPQILKQIAGFPLTRGVLCAMRRKPLPSVKEVCKDSRRVVVLSDVENPTNVGAIFRNAAALGVDAVVLTTDCADPLYRRAIRVSMGTVFQIPWTMADDVEELKNLGFAMAGLALRDDAVSLEELDMTGSDKLALVLGNEANGIAPDLLEQCEYTIKIPMDHGVDSLNVAAASAIAFWELTRK